MVHNSDRVRLPAARRLSSLSSPCQCSARSWASNTPRHTRAAQPRRRRHAVAETLASAENADKGPHSNSPTRRRSNTALTTRRAKADLGGASTVALQSGDKLVHTRPPLLPQPLPRLVAPFDRLPVPVRSAPRSPPHSPRPSWAERATQAPPSKTSSSQGGRRRRCWRRGAHTE